MADEPTGNLEDLHRNGSTIIPVTHEPDIAQAAARQILVKDGKITKDKSTSFNGNGGK